ncbi:MAG TPA: CHAD domain-containing protein [Solirubrobacteraceae bacterium]|nr:CHAD domain-containing protein [Solirubrobacteraceae bacterium]
MSRLELSPEQLYGDAGRMVVAARSRELFAHAGAVLDLDQPERVHKMRVATRRLRAGLEVFAQALDRRRVRGALSEVKALAAALGERRDCDVQLELLASLRRDAGRGERLAIDALREQFRDEQRQANARLAAALAHVQQAKLEKQLGRLAR